MSSEGTQTDPEQTGTEFNTHMTHDGAPGSHSALFGLGSDGKDDKKDGSKKPGDPIAGVKGDNSTGGSEPSPADPETKTANMADGTSTTAPPGAGSTENATEKVNPVKG